MKRLKNFLKQIENEFSEPSEEEQKYILEEVKRYYFKGVIPEDKRAKRLAYQLMKGMKKMVSSNIFPSMPHPQWALENPDGRCQPSDWVPSADWVEPSPPEPESEPVRKLHLVKKGEG